MAKKNRVIRQQPVETPPENEDINIDLEDNKETPETILVEPKQVEPTQLEPKIPEKSMPVTFEKEYFDWLKKECNFDAGMKGNWQLFYMRFLDSIFRFKGKTVVDLGCALGAITDFFKMFGAKAIGVDISQYAKDKSNFKNFEFIRTPAWDLSAIPDNSVDMIHSSYMFNMIPEDKCEEMFSEINRVCKHGALVFSILHMAPKKTKVNELETYYPKSFWDKFAGQFGMKDGMVLYYNKFCQASPISTNMFRQYRWEFLIYKVSKQ